jgi:hypothetical protein
MGLDGKAYRPSNVSQARTNSLQRYYMKYVKPQENKNVDVGRLTAQALDFSLGQALSFGPGIGKSALNYAVPMTKFENIYDWADPRNYEAQRMAKNAPGDLSGKTYKGPTKIYNN